jgi:aubergine-like protein
LEQLNRIVAMEYAGDGDEPPQEHPEITLIIVNKRVRQRFFQQTPGNNG